MTTPLFERFPGTAALPHFPIAELPTPVTIHRELTRTLGGATLLVKRDDASATPYGGNKVRKLEFLLGSALAEERRAIVTFGAFGSNHALATAIYGTRAGFDVHVVLAPQPYTPYLEDNLSALVATAAMNGAINESTFNFFFKLHYNKTFTAILATPLSAGDIAVGE